MKTTAIIDWYKKISKLACKNIDSMNRNNYTIDITYSISDDNYSYESVSIKFFDGKLKDAGQDWLITYSISDYLDEKQNRKTYKNIVEYFSKFDV